MIKVEYYAQTDVGKVRAENQDSYGFSEPANFYFVCDGMGGGAAGDFASRCAAHVIIHAFTYLTEKDIIKINGPFVESLTEYAMRPVAAIRLASRVLHNLTDKYNKLSGMGTTVAAILIDETEQAAHLYHVGDSRIYRFRDGCLELLTKDHSKINELIDEGKMQSDEVHTAEIQSMITRALGTASTVKIDYRKIAVRPYDCFILCSDGLNGEIDDYAISEIISNNKNDLEAVVNGLVTAANNAGGKDNTTVVGVRVVDQSDAGSCDDYSICASEEQFDVVTIPDETSDQSSSEDSIAKDILSSVHIKIPKTALDTSLFARPGLLAALFLVLLLAGGYVLTHIPGHVPNTALVDLAGKVTGVELSVRTPNVEQLKLYKDLGDDTIQKLQLIQDWFKEPNRLTEPLENAQIIVLSNEREEFKGMSTLSGVPIKISRGTYWLTLWYPGYSIMTEKMERRDTIPIVIESATSLKPMIVIMLPAD
ncbi:MAG: protein phosphatase 2C domain-containing protein [Endomicrobiales bacterium]